MCFFISTLFIAYTSCHISLYDILSFTCSRLSLAMLGPYSTVIGPIYKGQRAKCNMAFNILVSHGKFMLQLCWYLGRCPGLAVFCVGWCSVCTTSRIGVAIARHLPQVPCVYIYVYMDTMLTSVLQLDLT